MVYEQTAEHEGGHVGVSEARQGFAELVNRAAYRGDRVRIVRHGKPVAALIPIEDLDWLERLEDGMDLQAARDTLADAENAVRVPWEQVKGELGL
jgi:prevent-host-death family protein